MVESYSTHGNLAVKNSNNGIIGNMLIKDESHVKARNLEYNVILFYDEV